MVCGNIGSEFLITTTKLYGKIVQKDKLSELKKRLSSLERELSEVKDYLGFITEKNDQEIWEEIKPYYRKVQKEVFKENYPRLYDVLRGN